MTHAIHKLFFSRHEKCFTFFSFSFSKKIKIVADNLLLFQFFLPSKLHKLCYFLFKNIILHQKLHINRQKKDFFSSFLKIFWLSRYLNVRTKIWEQTLSNILFLPISRQCSFFIPPENVRKTKDFILFF